MKVYNKNVQILEDSIEKIDFILLESETVYRIDLNLVTVEKSLVVGQYSANDQVLLCKEYNDTNIIVYIKSENVIVTRINHIPTEQFQPTETSYEMTFENYSDLLSFKQTGETTFSMYNQTGNYLFSIHDIVTHDASVIVYPVDLELTTIEFRYLTVGRINYSNFYMFVIYDLFRKEITTKKVVFTVNSTIAELNFNLTDPNTLELSFNDESVSVNYKKVSRRGTKLFSVSQFKKYRNKHILGTIIINGSKYFLHNKTNGVFLTHSNPTRVSGFYPNMRAQFFGKSLYIYGRNTHYAYNANGKYDYLYAGDNPKPIAKFTRPFNLRLFRRYGFFKVPISSLYINTRIHNNLYLGNKKAILHNLKLKLRPRKAKTLDFTIYGDQVNIIRTNLRGDITSTIISKEEEYTLLKRNFIYVAFLLTKLIPKKKAKINLYFEKKSMKADESSIQVFEQVMKEKNLKSKNYFILSEDAENYQALKKAYKKAIVKKHSFYHYYLTFNASNLISSELSNHLLNDRLYIDVIREKIKSIPLIFLQHGIMFAKPVDNPMAFGFHKDKNAYNMNKSVISSELEAGEFYKMGYDREDLILTGLATFDKAYLNESADKIAFMPTYRYWEEGLIYRGLIEKTSYYEQIMRVIEAFKEHKLLDRLLIIPHNKFSEFIYENMKEYQHIISANPSEALKESVIFITDYSSAIYDATFRGAYPIFFWEEKDYLIEQYRAIPPVNDENAPGAIAYTISELMDTVKKAINQNYQVEDEILYKYKQINSFDDRQNTGRIIEFLKQDQIL
ncbi:CDP-glycerol glycerophosphotransferase family protein [Paenisporosarcina sp. OV554]|uniref:CDP-glycerol glycerophosphotransferase family protein n=1 Tax=Paenisporosarcina sp. OV554 TaxID=2135694 RepID=UPI000D333CB3|nr:CDP-glycerol glycerophosphotransferase family protein [Paenisporosarcina sp. OV554]PUB17837.1 CDP-glycerol:poly(glycerophosphate) glycerophosphotransferase [Paenisporosarcina sp. OV554]